VQHFSFYSDNCSGQNQNRLLYASYAHFAAQYHVSVIHRFLEAVHTQMEADSVHAQIEKAHKNCKIVTTQQWYGIMTSSKKTGDPYEMVEIDQSEIFDIKPFAAQTNWDRTVEGKKPKWAQVKEVRVEGSRANVVKFKTNQAVDQYEEVGLYTVEPVKLRGKKTEAVCV
jgi:hypothetical protein